MRYHSCNGNANADLDRPTETDDRRLETPATAAGRDRGTGKYLGAGLEKVHRIGAELDEQTPHVLSAAEHAVYAAFGIPPALWTASTTSSGLRDAWRQWRITLDAIAALVGDELRLKLHPNAKLSTVAMRLTDMTAIARSVHSLSQSGVAIEEALRIVGLDE